MDHCKSLVNLVSIDRVLNGVEVETLHIQIGASHSTGDNERTIFFHSPGWRESQWTLESIRKLK